MCVIDGWLVGWFGCGFSDGLEDGFQNRLETVAWRLDSAMDDSRMVCGLIL